MALKSLSEWIERTGISPAPWITGDWKGVMSIESRLLLDSLIQRKQYCGLKSSTFKISFNSMQQLSEEVLGIPFVVVEADLQPPTPITRFALLAAVICIRSSAPMKPKMLEKMAAPKMQFEMEDGQGAEIAVANCAVCLQHVYFIERVITQKRIYHRRCFVCSVCGKILHRFTHRIQNETFECYEHLPTTLLSVKWDKGEQRILKKPRPPPKPASLKKRAGITCAETKSRNMNELEANLSMSDTLVTRPVPLPRKTVATAEYSKKTTECTDDTETQPVPPPRPKRRSFLQQFGHSVTSPMVLSDRPSAALGSFSSMRDVARCKMTATHSSVVDYPGFLNPFSTDDDEDWISDANDCDNSLNPFDSCSGEQSAFENLSCASSADRFSANLLVNDDRLPSCPPPPPKPPRAMRRPSLTDVLSVGPSDLQQMMVSSFVKFPLKGTIDETKWETREVAGNVQKDLAEETYDEMSMKRIDEILCALEEQLNSTETEGKIFEEEVLVIMKQNTSEWMKNGHVLQWVAVFEKHCSLLRQQTVCVKKWMEKFLDQIHSETEMQLRHLIGCKGDKTSSEVKREAELLELLVDIINQKSVLVESNLVNTDVGTKTNATKKTRRIKTRLKELRKKLSKYGEGTE